MTIRTSPKMLLLRVIMVQCHRATVLFPNLRYQPMMLALRKGPYPAPPSPLINGPYSAPPSAYGVPLKGPYSTPPPAYGAPLQGPYVAPRPIYVAPPPVCPCVRNHHCQNEKPRPQESDSKCEDFCKGCCGVLLFFCLMDAIF
ncbi:extensin-like [Rhododendron vialii]|uniref:extensin-like n=1 Tax=Rhododendron vialii TaxID=182163 RepID=UPI00265DAA94|nr:extensin-like [Rhododendron vialii]